MKNQLKTQRVMHFTLIELLVVIAIIAILAGMLMPALNKARARGRTATCTSQLKDLSVSMRMYADAFNAVLDAGLRTADIVGNSGAEPLGTVEMTDAIISRI